MAKPHNVAEVTDLLVAAGVAAQVQEQDVRFEDFNNCLLWAETRHGQLVVVGEHPWQDGRRETSYVVRPQRFGISRALTEQQTALVQQLAAKNVD